jgi:hypothetical protein
MASNNPLYYSLSHAFILSNILHQYHINIAYCSIKKLYQSVGTVYVIGIYYYDCDGYLSVCHDSEQMFLVIKIHCGSINEVTVLNYLKGSPAIEYCK